MSKINNKIIITIIKINNSIINKHARQIMKYNYSLLAVYIIINNQEDLVIYLKINNSCKEKQNILS